MTKKNQFRLYAIAALVVGIWSGAAHAQVVQGTGSNAYSGIAAAAALAAIPDVDAGKTIAVGVGTGDYQGYQAWSVGATARLAENIKMRAGVSQGSSGTTWNLGAAMEW